MSIPVDKRTTKPTLSSDSRAPKLHDTNSPEGIENRQYDISHPRSKPHQYRIRPLGRFLPPWTRH
ncbi:MAG: hypothetical protein ABF812_16130 [Gluconobacter cerinus]|uniref:hypothetical protein n=1 Tax=Gluconobacter cerinus TaxID=38307 RepID=UPI0039ED916E